MVRVRVRNRLTNEWKLVQRLHKIAGQTLLYVSVCMCVHVYVCLCVGGAAGTEGVKREHGSKLQTGYPQLLFLPSEKITKLWFLK